MLKNDMSKKGYRKNLGEYADNIERTYSGNIVKATDRNILCVRDIRDANGNLVAEHINTRLTNKELIKQVKKMLQKNRYDVNFKGTVYMYRRNGSGSIDYSININKIEAK